MLKLAINHSLFPWSGAPQAYNSKLDFFLAAYLRFSANGFGVCSVTYRDITEAIGLSTNDAHAVPKARKKINGVIRNLLSRKGELYAEDFITIGAPDKKECEIKNGEIFKIPVEDMHTHQKTPYILVGTDEFCKIISAAKEARIKSAELFALYALIKSFMRPTGVEEDDGNILGCWLLREHITKTLDISTPTYMKYRRVLEENGLIFFKQGQARISPALFSTTNEPEVWAAIEETISGNEG